MKYFSGSKITSLFLAKKKYLAVFSSDKPFYSFFGGIVSNFQILTLHLFDCNVKNDVKFVAHSNSSKNITPLRCYLDTFISNTLERVIKRACLKS